MQHRPTQTINHAVRHAVWCLGLLVTAAAQATIGPPVKIIMPRDGAVPAVPGQEYVGTIQVRVGREGSLDGFHLEGESWHIVSLDVPDSKVLKPGEVLTITFHAIPGDASKPLTFTLRFDQQEVRKLFKLGPADFERLTKPRPLTRIGPGIPPGGGSGGGDAPEGGGYDIHFTGRLVYTRPAPAGQPAIVGADEVKVEIKDQDDVTADETIWEGLTDTNGFFDVTVFWDDCDILGCDAPDLYVRFETGTGVVDVEDPGLFETNYSWSTADSPGVVQDFSGTTYDFGTLTPSDSADFPALHIHTSIVRAHRFILTRDGTDVQHVDAQWPDGTSGAYYNGDVHVSTAEQWNEGIQTHEYGHHFLDHYSINTSPNYCNMICDSMGCGHCVWCQENLTDAWNEGWPDWFGDVVNRSYPADYGITALSIQDFRSNAELIGTCQVDGTFHNPLITEGFINALLRDIDDAIEDAEDTDGDGVADGDGNPDVQAACSRDALSLGVDEIFQVVRLDQPTTVTQFLTAFRNRFPQHAPGLWKTANSVGGNNYTWPDTAPPGAVTVLDSPTHPLGTGGGSPLITITWQEAPDDASGADVYAIGWSNTAQGAPFSMQIINGPDWATGQFIAVSPPVGIGSYWLSIRAQDCVGNWSDSIAFFGPFEVTDCNGNGIVDGCEVTCNLCDTLPSGSCTPAVQAFCNVPGCGTAADCNGNLAPDACDVASGSSGDCNANGLPDECESVTFVQWVGGSGSWNQASNWSPGLPGPGDHACIDVPGDITVTHSQAGTTQIASLGCYETFNLTNGTLSGTENFGFFGPLNFSGGTLAGAGNTQAYGGVTISTYSTSKNVARPFTNHATATWTGGTLGVSVGATFTNALGALFDDQQGANLNPSGQPQNNSITWISGSQPGIFNNAGTFRKSTGTGTTTISFVPFNNAGTAEVLAGTLSLTAGGTSSGIFNGAPGATLRFAGGTHDLTSTSSINADTVQISSGNVNVGGTYQINGTSGLLNLTNGTLALDSGAPVIVPNYTQSAGTLTGSSAFHVTGLLDFAGGTMSGSGTTNADGTLTISNYSTSKNAARNFTNNGTATWTGGTLGISAGATFTNAPGRLFDDQQGANLNPSGLPQDNNITWSSGSQPGIFNNAGTFRKSSGTGTTAVGFVPFNNSGIVEVLAGTLSLNAGGTSGGTFNGLPGAILRFGGGTHDLIGSSMINADTVHVTSGTVNLDGSYQISGTSALLNLTSATLNTNSPIAVPNYTQSGGTLTGSGNLTVSQALTWSGGTMAGSGMTQANAVLTISNYSTTKNTTRNLVNNGTATWTGGTLGLSAGATFTNAPGRLFDDQQGANLNPSGLPQDNNITWSSGPQPGVFNNVGTFRKSSGMGTTNVSFVPFNNSGIVEVLAGTLNLTAGGTSSGIFNGVPGATLRFGGGTHDLTSASAINAHTVHVASGTLNVGGLYQMAGTSGLLNLTNGTIAVDSSQPVIVPNYTQTGGTLTGSSAFHVTGLLEFAGGTMSGSGSTNANGSLNISNYSTTKNITRTFVNNGTATWTGGTLGINAGATFTNALGALFDDQQGANQNPSGIPQDNNITWSSGPQTGVFNNAGTFRKSSGSGTTNISFVPFNNSGTLEVLAGTLAFGTGGMTQTAGETILNGGNIQTSTPIALQGGTLRGNGTITGSVNSSGGTVAPGLSPGMLTISGNYTNNGTLAIELGGTTAGNGFDVLAVGGTATLGGTLQVTLVNSFNPPPGTTYQILTAGTRNGIFANVSTPPTLQVNVIYGPSSVTLEIGSTPTPVDIVSANPPLTNPFGSGVFRDVLQNTNAALAPQGIGVAGTPDQGPYTYAPFSVTFSGTPTPLPAPGNITVSCTDIAGNGAADCPGIASVGGAGAGPWTITLTAPPPPRECITFNFAGTNAGQRLQYQSLPGDTNLNGNVNTQDLLWLVQRINDGLANQAANLARYNIDRSSGSSPVNTQDLLRLVQLLNGVNATQVFNGASVAVCP
ncbi:MAG TPA: hypothetical protein VGM03_10770 [Phycisphaerae bacterium]